MKRCLSWLDGDAPGSRPSKLRSYRVILALVVATEYAIKALERPDSAGPAEIVTLVVVTLLAAAVVTDRGARAAMAGIALLQLVYVWGQFPHAGNHRYLEAVLAFYLAVLDPRRPDDARLALCSLRWTVVVVLFYSGAQKLIHGYWFDGQFLAHAMWRDGFATAFSGWLAPDDAARLATYGGEPGDGPYRLGGLLLPLVSNAVWISELALSVLLVPRRTRRVAWVVAVAFMVAVEVVARELMFGIEFACALLLFAYPDRVRRAVLPVAVLLGLLVLVRLGLLPEVRFH